MKPKDLGVLGEKIAVKFLKSRRYKILEKNWEFRVGGRKRGEIDVVAKKDSAFVFVEVKTLANQEFLAENRVDFGKKRRLMATAEVWLKQNKISLDAPWQIDIISVYPDFKKKKARVVHFPNALEA